MPWLLWKCIVDEAIVMAVDPPLKSSSGALEDMTFTFEPETRIELLAEISPSGIFTAETVMRAAPTVLSPWNPISELYLTPVEVTAELHTK